MTKSALIDIIVPVYRGLDETRRCIEAVFAYPQATPYCLVVVDDATPEPALAVYLDDLAADGRLTLLRNASNLGFVASVNAGMMLHPERDVVLLNSDTEVANDWLDRLRHCVHERSDCGTATPFSNNATICSFPRFCAENALPTGFDTRQLDEVFRRVNRGRTVALPSAVGFCMYIRRECLQQVGYFDAESFGRGYGEENDFCCRASSAGWRHLLCADTFVYHAGAVSFSAERERRVAEAMATLRRLHPGYETGVREFILADPVAELRQAAEIEAAVVLASRSQTTARPTAETPRPAQRVVLHVTHDLGGGIERWLGDYCGADKDHTHLVLRPYSGSHERGEGLALYVGADDVVPTRLWLFTTSIGVTAVTHREYQSALAAVLESHAVDAIIVSSLIGHALDILDTGLPTLFICHDYFPACPAINAYFDGPCSSCSSEHLATCTRDNGDFNPFYRFAASERESVREAFGAKVRTGRVVLVAPTRTAIEHVQRLLPSLAIVPTLPIPHGCGERLAPIVITEAPPQRLRVMVLGMLSVSKGVKLLLERLEEITAFADLYLVGAREVGELFRYRPSVHVVDHYKLPELHDIVADIRPDVGLLLSVWPETFSYTLSELMMMEIPPVATAIGAFSERIRHNETGYLFPVDGAAMVDQLRRIDADRETLVLVRRNLGRLRHRTAEDMVADYAALLEGLASLTSLPRPAWPTLEPVTDPERVALAMARREAWQRLKSRHLLLSQRERRLDQIRTEYSLIPEQRERDLTELHRQLQEAETRTRDRQAAIDGVYASSSWRLTGPLRTLIQRFRQS